MNGTRRDFLCSSGATVAAILTTELQSADPTPQPHRKGMILKSLREEIGMTTSSVGSQTSGRGDRKFTLLELPKIMREELDMKVIDLNTSTLASEKPAYLDKVRQAADKAGCILTNLKLNQRGLDMNSRDKDVRQKALTAYKRSIDAASHLGLLWARPLPLKETPDSKIHIDSYRELCDYGAKRNVEMLVENFGWMQSDPDSVVKLIKAIGKNVAACPDTGNWNSNELRYAGLKRTFPLAVTCDYKAREMGLSGEHKLYDLKRCFTIGWEAGFRGPWCLEHAHTDTKRLFKELGMLRDMLRKWMAEVKRKKP